MAVASTTMNDTSSERRPTESPLLTPTDALEQLWLRTISMAVASTTMDDTSSERRPTESPLLTPTDALEQLWLREVLLEFPFNEYLLNGIPESLETSLTSS
jgi:hypothetical protein